MVFSLLLLTACGLSRPFPSIRTFTLTPPEDAQPAETARSAARSSRRPILIQVTSSGASAQYETKKLVHKVGPNEFSEDFYNELVGLPARLAIEAASNGLNDSPANLAVTKGLGLETPNYVLDIYLTAFHGDYTSSPPKAVFEARFSLTEQRRVRSPSVQSWILSGSAIVTDRGDPPADLAAALGQALVQATNELVSRVELAVKAR
jgi:hypothetical protein